MPNLQGPWPFLVDILPMVHETQLRMLKKPPIILCVDDDPDDQMLMVETIGEMAKEVRIACALNGTEALHYLERVKRSEELPSMIILDINMPPLNGKETLLKLKNDPVLKSIPVVILTTSPSKDDHSYCMKHGASLFRIKPVTEAGLHEIAKEVLQLLGIEVKIH